MACEADPFFASRYEGWRELGRGAFSIVVATRLRRVDIPLALKFVWEDSSQRQLLAEARALSRIVHPNVVRIFAVCEHRGAAWIELELVEGATLRDAMIAQRGRPWPITEALEVGACLAEGLAAVHAAGFVHRDLKPGNVLLPSSGNPVAKLADFGIARSVDATLITGETLLGSPGYVSPEATRNAVPGPQADVYALALIVYELLSGRNPYGFADETPVAAMLACHANQSVAPLTGLDVSRDLVDALQRALAKDPRRRPPAAELAQVLRAEILFGAGRPALVADTTPHVGHWISGFALAWVVSLAALLFGAWLNLHG